MRVIVSRTLVLRRYQPLFFNRKASQRTRPSSSGSGRRKRPRTSRFACPVSLKADLDHFAELSAQKYREAVDAMTVIPHMLEALMAGDRGFRQGTATGK